MSNAPEKSGPSTDSEFDAAILKEFINESLGGLDDLLPKMLHFNENGGEALDAVFRWVHTVKGTSGFLNLTFLQEFCHGFESFLQDQKGKSTGLNHTSQELITEGVDLVGDALQGIENGQTELTDSYDQFISSLRTSDDNKSFESLKNECYRLLDQDLSHILDVPEQSDRLKELLNNVKEFLGTTQREELSTLVARTGVLVKHVFDPDGHDITESVKKVVMAFERLLVTKSLNVITPEIEATVDDLHKRIYPRETSPKFSCNALFQLYEPMPEEVTANFWRAYWTEGIERTCQLHMDNPEDLIRPSKSAAPDIDKRDTAKPDAPPQTTETLRIDAGYLDQFTRRTEALLMNRNYLTHLEHEMRSHMPAQMAKDLSSGLTDLEKNIGGLQKALFTIRSSRLTELFERVPRMLRQLEKDLGRQVQLEIHGEELEVDRSVIPVLGDPLVHLVRNAVDHGIEPPDIREKMGKPAAGSLKLSAEKIEDNLVLTIADDGKGIDTQKVFAKAIEKGLALADKDYSDSEIYQFLLQPGFSMAEKITNVSGRGVGMDVVTSAINKQGGQVTIQSTPGQGSTVELSMPLKLGTLTKEVLVIEVDRCQYAVNHDSLQEVLQADAISLAAFDGRTFLCHRDQLLPIIDLGQILHGDLKHIKRDFLNGRYLIVEDEERQTLAIRVDKTLNRMQVVIKPFDHEFLKRHPLFEGTVVVGTGKPIMALSVMGMIHYE